MAWDTTMRGDKERKSDKQLAHIVYTRFESGDTKDGIKFSLGGLYVREHVGLISKEALKNIYRIDPGVEITDKGVAYGVLPVGKMRVTYEHIIPVEALYQHLAQLYRDDKLSERYIVKLIPMLMIAVITTEENKMLRNAGYNETMPTEWSWSMRDPLMRYRAAGLDDSIWVSLKG